MSGMYLRNSVLGVNGTTRSADFQRAELGVLLAQTAFGEAVIIPGLFQLRE